MITVRKIEAAVERVEREAPPLTPDQAASLAVLFSRKRPPKGPARRFVWIG
jgi:hypothetical protein